MIETKFKETEFGSIPTDWSVSKFGCVLDTFTTGATPYRGTPENFNGKVRWITSGELNYNTITDTIEHISEDAMRDTHLTLYQPGTFLMAITGLEAEGTRGRCAFVGKPSTTNQSCLAINEQDEVCVEWVYWFYRKYSDYLAFKYSQGTKQQSYTAKIVEHLPIFYPELPEQRRIASALSSVDELISSLDTLIEKKQNIKLGAMQQLLTGKKRLKGFNQPWVEKKLGDVLSYEQPTQYLVSSTDYYDKGIPVLTAGKTFILGYTHEENGIYTNLPVIIFDDFVTESKFVDFPFKAKSSAMKMLTPVGIDTYDLHLIYEVMQTIQYAVGDHKRHWISEYSELTIRIPSTIEEQRAIAAVLTNMDDEIAALEQKRDKYITVKQGMMQQLLTGKIRLI